MTPIKLETPETVGAVSAIWRNSIENDLLIGEPENGSLSSAMQVLKQLVTKQLGGGSSGSPATTTSTSGVK